MLRSLAVPTLRSLLSKPDPVADSATRKAGPQPAERLPVQRPLRVNPLAADYAVLLLLCLLVLVLHNVRYLLSQPYWNDEAWVAVTTRFPLSRLPQLTSSTPIGWSLLLRLATIGRSQSGRLLPLAFAGIAVIPGYWLARRLDWQDRGTSIAAAVLAAASVLLVPAMLVRDDLKQYTADACMTLVILATTARLERRWSPRGLALLAVAIGAGMLVSDAAAFAGAAALAAVGLTQLARRNWRRLAEAAIAAAGTTAVGAAIYESFDARAVVPGLTAYWQNYYLPVHGGPAGMLRFVTGQFDLIRGYFGLGPWWLAIPLVLAGLATIARFGRPATALTAAALWPEMLALSALRKYPFLDLRTSTFLITSTAVVAAIGVAGLCAALRARLGAVLRARQRDGSRLATVAAALVAATALAGFGLAARPYVRSQLIPWEPIRQQAQYVARHAGPRDPIVVSANSNWGFAYYWPGGRPGSRPDPANLQGYQAIFPAQPRIVVAAQRDAAGIRAAIASALRLAPHGQCSRIWLVRTHVNAAELAAWRTVLAQLRLAPASGGYGVAYIQLGPAGCR
jgi:hypothetical protein